MVKFRRRSMFLRSRGWWEAVHLSFIHKIFSSVLRDEGDMTGYPQLLATAVVTCWARKQCLLTPAAGTTSSKMQFVDSRTSNCSFQRRLEQAGPDRNRWQVLWSLQKQVASILLYTGRCKALFSIKMKACRLFLHFSCQQQYAKSWSCSQYRTHPKQ